VVSGQVTQSSSTSGAEERGRCLGTLLGTHDEPGPECRRRNAPPPLALTNHNKNRLGPKPTGTVTLVFQDIEGGWCHSKGCRTHQERPPTVSMEACG
jgi:hypothetical protein